ncbi:hypothetical protein ACFSPU_05995 [Haoranjiania flava]|uniref:Uncharacterized protein n=1 Tax=Haoranjiania flava TaxID=1856322 RepID=A0AAE3IQG9_9BACT|nr:hypothetical protein [Haoranjiania flava]MCU7695286.1 hypothetical protein [Haoranjiania flava]
MQVLANLRTLILTKSNKVRKLEIIISTFKDLCKCENISDVYTRQDYYAYITVAGKAG